MVISDLCAHTPPWTDLHQIWYWGTSCRRNHLWRSVNGGRFLGWFENQGSHSRVELSWAESLSPLTLCCRFRYRAASDIVIMQAKKPLSRPLYRLRTYNYASLSFWHVLGAAATDIHRWRTLLRRNAIARVAALALSAFHPTDKYPSVNYDHTAENNQLNKISEVTKRAICWNNDNV